MGSGRGAHHGHGTIVAVTWLILLVAVLVIGAAVVVAYAGGADLSVAHDDRPDVVVPSDRLMHAEDLDRVRFSTAVRGYRMDEVDDLVDRLRAELAERDGMR